MLTTEQVAERLGITVEEVYATRRRNEYPGNLGHRRGRRLIFPDDLAPTEPETTNDPPTAILWALEGIHRTLRSIDTQLRAQAPYRVEWGWGGSTHIDDNTEEE